jgi:acetone monooxygenase
MTDTEKQPDDHSEKFDAIVVGAGFSGLYLLHRLREMGLSVRVLEAGGSVGGTWYWNRYPGARCDSASHVYQFWFSKDVLEEWRWTERFSTQPQMLEYFEYVADKCDLKRDIRFNAQVTQARFDEQGERWHIETRDGYCCTAPIFVSAVGSLTEPNVPGLETFAGEHYHTSRWPHRDVDLAGKRVGLIGTGATGIQVIQSSASTVGELVVFQRTPNYVVSMRNRELEQDDWDWLHNNHAELEERVMNSPYGMDYFIREGADQLSDEELEQEMEALWQKGSMEFWNGSFVEAFQNGRVNDKFTEFVRRKMREKIHDPEKAAKAIPSDHSFSGKRVPLEYGYLDALNRDNVKIVDIKAEPLERFTQTGIEAGGTEYPLDVIIFATGFDAVTGAVLAMNISGRDGRRLEDEWRDGAAAHLATMSAGFPNLFMVSGPSAPSAAFCNVPACAFDQIDWILHCIKSLRNDGLSTMEATESGQEAWVEHVEESLTGTVLADTNSWYMGSNVPGKARRLLTYLPGRLQFREKLWGAAENDFEGFERH